MPDPHARWQASEQRLALVAVADPDRYVELLESVGRIADRLRDVRDVEALLDAWERWKVIADPLVASDRRDTPDTLEALAGTAWLVRYRELAAGQAEVAFAERLAEARRQGVRWFPLAEHATATSAVLGYPYEQTTVRLTDGTALRAFVETDPDTYGPLYGVEVLSIDLDAGGVVTGRGERRTFPDEDEWRQGIEELRSRLDSGSRD